MEELTGELRRHYNEEIHNMNSLQNTCYSGDQFSRFECTGMWQFWGRGAVHARFWWGNVKGENIWKTYAYGG